MEYVKKGFLATMGVVVGIIMVGGIIWLSIFGVSKIKEAKNRPPEPPKDGVVVFHDNVGYCFVHNGTKYHFVDPDINICEVNGKMYITEAEKNKVIHDTLR